MGDSLRNPFHVEKLPLLGRLHQRAFRAGSPQGNPLLREPLRPEHIKPRLLGHWGTSPGLNLVYTHLNRHIRRSGEEVQ